MCGESSCLLLVSIYSSFAQYDSHCWKLNEMGYGIVPHWKPYQVFPSLLVPTLDYGNLKAHEVLEEGDSNRLSLDEINTHTHIRARSFGLDWLGAVWCGEVRCLDRIIFFGQNLNEKIRLLFFIYLEFVSEKLHPLRSDCNHARLSAWLTLRRSFPFSTFRRPLAYHRRLRSYTEGGVPSAQLVNAH